MMCPIDHAVAQLNRPVTLQSTERIYAQSIGSWSENVVGWLMHARIPVRCVRYETLVSDPRRAFKIVLDWLELPFEEERFAASLKFIQFENLQKLEEKKSFKESRGAQGFFRRGIAGGWMDSLTFQQAQTILRDHWDAMKLIGYVK